jgi:hypothetical protein
MTEQKRKKTPAGRKYTALVAWLKQRLTDPNATDKIKDAAANRLVEVLMHLDNLEDKKAERALRRELAQLSTPAPVSPDTTAQVIKELQAEVARKKAAGVY